MSVILESLPIGQKVVGGETVLDEGLSAGEGVMEWVTLNSAFHDRVVWRDGLNARPSSCAVPSTPRSGLAT